MGRYSRISRRIWNDSKFKALSPLQPSGQALWLYLLTCIENQNVPGLFEAREVALADKLGWSMQAFRKAFAEVKEQGMIDADWDAGLLWLPKSINHNRPVSLNVVKSWSNTWDDLPECELKTKAYQELLTYMEGLGEGYSLAFRLACPKPNEKVSPIQLQIQIQEQKQKTELLSRSSKEVFEYWQSKAENGSIYKYTQDREGKLKARLNEGYTVDELCKAIDGCFANSWYVEKKRTDIVTIFKSAASTDQHIHFEPEGGDDRRQELYDEWEREAKEDYERAQREGKCD